ncbi:MAG: hypothetical protein KAR40_13160 [Candidatus Sabulitectum sp.]|nr:hypothetical protein [Candidatus Sabulitectum sp.]
MAEAIRKGRLAFLEQFAKLFASVLSISGVLSSGCDLVSADYGPPGSNLSVYGRTYSSEDSSTVMGLEIRLTSPDSTVDYGSVITPTTRLAPLRLAV